MELSESEITDLRYLRQRYGWDDQGARDVMQSIQATPDGARYYTVLAAAHRAGYKQDAGNSFMRLRDWCLARGLDDPYGDDFDPAALDALAVQERAA
jgi:hypothetical protein